MRPDLAHWERHDVLPDGTRVLVRPLKFEDAALYPDFAEDVTPDDARLRFFAPISELSNDRIHELTHLDYERAMAFISIARAANTPLSCAPGSKVMASAGC